MKLITSLLTSLMLFIPLESSAQTSEDPSATIDSFRAALGEGVSGWLIAVLYNKQI